ncbi:MAG: cell division protein FtsL [Gammaproteobacteria bacterium]
MTPKTVELIATLILFLLVVASALAIVGNMDNRRQLFTSMQMQRQDQDRIDSQWRQLMLEQAALSAQVEVDSVAGDRLKMALPDRQSTILVSR